jgi:hypothetical protein
MSFQFDDFLTYYNGDDYAVNNDDNVLTIYLKNILLNRALPGEYVYHVSPYKNRESILAYGLQTNTSSNWGIEYAYPKAIFAMKDFKNLWQDGRGDIWKIDTKNLHNKW